MSSAAGFSGSESFTKPPERLVSLVPSLTASLFDLDFGDRVVGVTDYCPQLQQSGSALPTIGGPRDPDIARILSLKPDLVLANQEENRRDDVEQLRAGGLQVWVTFPRSIDEAIEMLWALLRIIPADSRATNKLLVLERSLEWVRRSVDEQQAQPVFYPIWMDKLRDRPWFMTIHGNTYAHDVLEVCGARNIFAARERRYPLEADLGLCQPEAVGDRDRRYPRVSLEEVLAAAPELILLPDEPFAFDEAHIVQFHELFHDTPAGRTANIHKIDGRLVHWHGTMLARALAELPQLIQESNQP